MMMVKMVVVVMMVMVVMMAMMAMMVMVVMMHIGRRRRKSSAIRNPGATHIEKSAG